MKMFNFFLLLISICLLFISCDPCGNLDCISDNYSGQFRILRSTDGNDLVFGSNSVYDKNAIEFYTLKDTDTTFFEYQALKFPGAGYDSILQVRFFPKTDIAYMDLGNGDVDTLQISYKTYDTKCCGTITEITSFRYNNLIDIPGDRGTQELKK